jgi:hypothetical protein
LFAEFVYRGLGKEPPVVASSSSQKGGLKYRETVPLFSFADLTYMEDWEKDHPLPPQVADNKRGFESLETVSLCLFAELAYMEGLGKVPPGAFPANR